MKHLYHIGGLALIYGLAVYLISTARKNDTEALRAHLLDPTTMRGVDWFPGHGLSVGDRHRYLQGIEERVFRLASMETERNKRRRAHLRSDDSRRHWQWELRTSWQELVTINYPAYQKLLDEARQNPNGNTPCTLCDGMSYMPCLLCPSHNGQCVDCSGRGRRGSEYCPTCVGTGNCYLCTGYGKMFCPFCDDGTITVNYRKPPALPPVE